MNKEKLASTVLNSLAGVALFLGLNFWIDINGYSNYSYFLMLLGVGIIIWMKPLLKLFNGFHFLGKTVLNTMSHVLIFLGAKIFFNQFIDVAWVVYIVVGIFILNNHDAIAKKLFKGK